MAPHHHMEYPQERSIERTDEYHDFIQRLAAYHAQRGTSFEPEPRVGSRHVDLLRLYRVVLGRGGYDKVSATKLEWRTIGEEFNLGISNLPALAFNMKTTYYKYLSAFEISTYWKREPPPKDILEDVSARGGELLTRTRENYRHRENRYPTTIVNGEESEGDAHGGARADMRGMDELNNTGRGTRGLRQAPPQRVLYQPEIPVRHPRTSAAHINQTQASAAAIASVFQNSSANPLSNSFTVASYEPRPSMPLPLRPVVTPLQNPFTFQENYKRSQAKEMAKNTEPDPYADVMLPGTASSGPNIYIRVLASLRSPLPAEHAFALHHLVKMSYERGEKYKLDTFPGLAEGLIYKILEVASLFHEVTWKVSFDEEEFLHQDHVLNGVSGTPDILEQIAELRLKDHTDGMESEEFSNKLQLCTEAALVLRNLVMLKENAVYLAKLRITRDMLIIVLGLPTLSLTAEIKSNILEICEELTKFYPFEETGPLYTSLLRQLKSTDRGTLIAALRSISRFSRETEHPGAPRSVPMPILRETCDYMLLDDEDLVYACVDFLYLYTCEVDNVESLIYGLPMRPTVNHLIRMLSHNAKRVEVRTLITPFVKGPAPTEFLTIPNELVEEFVKFEEPDRSKYWLRGCFELDPDGEIKQIDLWNQYNRTFSPYDSREPGKPSLPAAEFIKNVSSTFGEHRAKAEVVGAAEGTPRFIIKGIRHRLRPIDPRGKEYLKCQWRLPRKHDYESCKEFFSTPELLWRHIVGLHLRVPKDASGAFLNDRTSGRTYNCQWDKCRRFAPDGHSELIEVTKHIRLHVSEDSSIDANLHKTHTKAPAENGDVEATYKTQVFFDTPVEPRHEHHSKTYEPEPKGLACGAALVLRNLAQTIRRVDDPQKRQAMMDEAFGGFTQRIFEVLAHNRSLKRQISDLVYAIG